MSSSDNRITFADDVEETIPFSLTKTFPKPTTTKTEKAKSGLCDLIPTYSNSAGNIDNIDVNTSLQKKKKHKKERRDSTGQSPRNAVCLTKTDSRKKDNEISDAEAAETADHSVKERKPGKKKKKKDKKRDAR